MEGDEMRVVFKKQVHSCVASWSSNDVYLEREIEMPFVPPIGMEVCDGDWSAEVASLRWKNGTVFAFTEADKELYNHQLHRRTEPARPLDEIVKDWTKCGWQLTKPLPTV